MTDGKSTSPAWPELLPSYVAGVQFPGWYRIIFTVVAACVVFILGNVINKLRMRYWYLWALRKFPKHPNHTFLFGDLPEELENLAETISRMAEGKEKQLANDKFNDKHTNMLRIIKDLSEEKVNKAEENSREAHQEKRRAEQERRNAEQRARIAEQKERVSEQERKDTQQEKRVAEQRARIAEQNERVAEQNERVAEQERGVAEQRARIAEQNERVAKQERRAAERRARIAEQNERVAEQRLNDFELRWREKYHQVHYELSKHHAVIAQMVAMISYEGGNPTIPIQESNSTAAEANNRTPLPAPILRQPSLERMVCAACRNAEFPCSGIGMQMFENHQRSECTERHLRMQWRMQCSAQKT